MVRTTARKSEYGRIKARKPKPAPPAFLPSRDVSLPESQDKAMTTLLKDHCFLLDSIAAPLLRQIAEFAEYGGLYREDSFDTEIERLKVEEKIKRLASLSYGEPWAIQAIIEACKSNTKGAHDHDDIWCFIDGCRVLDEKMVPLVRSRLEKGTKKELFAIGRSVLEVRKMAGSLIWANRPILTGPPKMLWKESYNSCFEGSAALLGCQHSILTAAMLVEKVAGDYLPPELTTMIEEFYTKDATNLVAHMESQNFRSRRPDHNEIFLTTEEVAEYHRKVQEAKRLEGEARRGGYVPKSDIYLERYPSPEL